MKQLVSIIVPIYNCEKFLEECILSILQQSYKDIEIILINDGSEDLSGEIALSYSKIDSRITYIKKNNEGVSNARNLGIKLAKGEYISFVDADDIIGKTYIEDMIEEITDVDFVLSGYKVWEMKKNKYIENKCPYFKGNIDEFILKIFDYINTPFLLGPCFKLFKLDILRKEEIKFPEELSYGEDALFVIEYLKKIKKIGCIENMNYTYRKCREDSLSSVYREDRIDIFYRINNNLKQLVTAYTNTLDEEIDKMFLQNFIYFLQELFCSNISYKKKKEIFYIKINEYNIDRLYYKIGKKSLIQKIFWFSYKTNAILVINILFKINNFRRRK